MPVDFRHPAFALARALTGSSLTPPGTRLEALRRLASLCRRPAIKAALQSEATSVAEVRRLTAALRGLVRDAERALAKWEQASAAPPTAVAIILQDGVVQQICSAKPLPDLRFETVDYDVDSSDAGEADLVTFVDGTASKAWRHLESVEFPSDIDWTRFDADPA